MCSEDAHCTLGRKGGGLNIHTEDFMFSFTCPALKYKCSFINRIQMILVCWSCIQWDCLYSLINSNSFFFLFCRFLGILYGDNHVTCKERKFYFFFSFYFLPFLIVLPIISSTAFNKTDGNEDYFFVSDPKDKLKSFITLWVMLLYGFL